MQLVPVHRRIPRAGIDPIDDADTAFVTISMAVHLPLRCETILVLLDDGRRGIGVVAVSDTYEPDAVLEVFECVLDPSAHGGRVGAVIVASVRPDPSDATIDPDVDPGADDVDRWLEMSDLAEQRGVELLEWFVITDEVSCPRDRLGEAPRW
jgi:hypothetical protein